MPSTRRCIDCFLESLSSDQSNRLPELLEKKLGDFIEAIIRALVDVDVENVRLRSFSSSFSIPVQDTVKNELSSLLIRLSLNERLTNLAVIRMVACVGDFGSLLRRVAQSMWNIFLGKIGNQRFLSPAQGLNC